MAGFTRIFKRGKNTKGTGPFSCPQLVATFEFGETHSGYACSYRDDPTQIQRNQGRNVGREEFISFKIPTCMLLRPNKKNDAFGFEAEKRYADLAKNDKHRGWMLFKGFNMLLHNNQVLTQGSTVEDINGNQSMSTMEIFRMSIRFLRKHLLKALSSQKVRVNESDIQYEITVPASWNDNTKTFLMETAVQAGLDSQRVSFSLEPEAASIRCQTVNTDAKSSLSGNDCHYIEHGELDIKGTETSTGYLIVAAFDIGTAYSGYAYSFRNDPMKIRTNRGWNAGSEQLISQKTPTCVLLRPDKQFESFGYEAENRYFDLAENNKHHGWMLFRRFKMFLHNNDGLTRSSTVEDINGKSMPAMQIFSMVIGFLKDHLLKTLNSQTVGVEENDIQYVITVPAIWNDHAKQFMREAAMQAGMDSSRLRLSLEPEAASIWCQTVNTDVRSSISDIGCQYMVVDLGGGTADISVHEKKADGSLKEIHKASGGPWGGTVVDKNYFEWLTKLFGQKAMQRFKDEQMADYFDVQREFEIKKRTISSDSQRMITVKVSALLREIYQEVGGLDLKIKLAEMELTDLVNFTVDKLRVDASIARGWFKVPINEISVHMKNLLAEEKMTQVKKILLVGGFGECQLVQEALRAQIQNKDIIVLPDAGLAVLNGAVRYGHLPEIVSSRVMKYTYGVNVTVVKKDETQSDSEAEHHYNEILNSEDDKHSDSKDNSNSEFRDDKTFKVRDVFDKFVEIREELPVGHEVRRVYTPTNPNRVEIQVYCSIDPNPTLVTDEGCKNLGVLSIDFQDGETCEDNVSEVTLVFGDTELIVKAKILRTEQEFYTRIDCLK